MGNDRTTSGLIATRDNVRIVREVTPFDSSGRRPIERRGKNNDGDKRPLARHPVTAMTSSGFGLHGTRAKHYVYLF
ncbi:hypothetical protein L596_026038 [Steinernema carpocapsae]|uniref:Uncharacterized protein n=1 Tax=Steinernema carpocapsae TaxID=34508 RepID=A0A4U5M060_STECR|nr:hypothetical protein L596_026038 [Steinernema carpocapsae]